MDDVSYTVYRPKKLHIGVPHPDPVVENTSMAAVDPPELWYNLKLQVCLRVCVLCFFFSFFSVCASPALTG